MNSASNWRPYFGWFIQWPSSRTGSLSLTNTLPANFTMAPSAVRRRPARKRRARVEDRLHDATDAGALCLSCTPPRVRGEQVSLHKVAGGLAIRAEEDRDSVVEDDRQRVPQHRVGVRLTPVTPLQNVGECRPPPRRKPRGSPASFCNSARNRSRLWITVETKSSSVFRSTATHASMPVHGVIPGWQCPPHCGCQPGIERIRFLFARVDDDGGGLLARTGQARPPPPAGTCPVSGRSRCGC